jgi:hypothetical protein
MPLDMALAVYWKIKKWRIDINMTASSQSAPPSSIYLEWSFSFSQEIEVGQHRILELNSDGETQNDILVGNAPKNESKIVCGTDAATYDFTFFGNEDEGGVQTFEVTARSHFSLDYNASRLVAENNPTFGGRNRYKVSYDYGGFPSFYRKNTSNDSKEYYPALSLFVALPNGYVITENRNAAEDEIVGQFTYKFLNQTFVADLWGYNSRLRPGASAAADVQIELTAQEYWSYDPQDGLGPIYDKDTGQQLRPFPN